MPGDKDFQTKVQRIGELVHGLENISDAESRARAKALVQLLLELHAVALERVMEIVASGGEAGLRAIDDLGRDPLVSSLLVLYGLHPLDFESRVAQAVEKVRPQVRKGGGELDLISIKGDVVRLKLQVTGHACASTGRTLKSLVEGALYESAPDMTTLLIEGLDDEAGSSGFVPLGKLGGVIAPASAMSD
ncbi:MAG: NifU family protein [Candidatus Sulfotelmatobacter sp.]